MTHGIVNYHYIRERGDNGIHPCTIERFGAQVEYLAREYEIVSVADLVRLVREGNLGKLCALTFDDGLFEHYAVALPILRERRIPGTFFPLGLPLREARIPLPHKLHLLLSRLPTDQLIGMLERFFAGGIRIDREQRTNPERRFDDVLTANLKEALIAMPYADRSRFIESAFRDICPDEADLARSVFLSQEHIREMAAAGMVIGGHGDGHVALNTLAADAQERDIAAGDGEIARIIGKQPSIFAYPHGRYTPDTIAALKRRGYAWGVVLGARDVGPRDDAFEIPRYDTNDITI